MTKERFLLFLLSQDGEIAKAFQREMEKTGIKFQLGTKVVGADVREDSATLHVGKLLGFCWPSLSLLCVHKTMHI